MNLNKVFLIGNLTRDPEVRTTPSGQTVATLGIATNRVWTNPQTGQKNEQVEYHNVVCWARLGELAGQYLAKGRSVFVEGRLATRSWQDQKSGEKRFRTEIIAENIQFGPRPGSATMAGDKQPTATSDGPKTGEQDPQATPAEELPVIQEDEPDIAVKDIPF